MEIKNIKLANLPVVFDQLIKSGKVVMAPVLKKSGKVFFRSRNCLRSGGYGLYSNRFFGQISCFSKSGRIIFVRKKR